LASTTSSRSGWILPVPTPSVSGAPLTCAVDPVPASWRVLIFSAISHPPFHEVVPLPWAINARDGPCFPALPPLCSFLLLAPIRPAPRFETAPLIYALPPAKRPPLWRMAPRCRPALCTFLGAPFFFSSQLPLTATQVVFCPWPGGCSHQPLPHSSLKAPCLAVRFLIAATPRGGGACHSSLPGRRPSRASCGFLFFFLRPCASPRSTRFGLPLLGRCALPCFLTTICAFSTWPSLPLICSPACSPFFPSVPILKLSFAGCKQISFHSPLSPVLCPPHNFFPSTRRKGPQYENFFDSFSLFPRPCRILTTPPRAGGFFAFFVAESGVSWRPNFLGRPFGASSDFISSGGHMPCSSRLFFFFRLCSTRSLLSVLGCHLTYPRPITEFRVPSLGFRYPPASASDPAKLPMPLAMSPLRQADPPSPD